MGFGCLTTMDSLKTFEFDALGDNRGCSVQSPGLNRPRVQDCSDWSWGSSPPFIRVLYANVFLCLSAMAMPSSLLWAVDIFGRVYTLATTGQYWELCKDGQLEFKRVSAVKQCCWGIACDHQVYTYVFSSDVPIRYQEETYENQVCKSRAYLQKLPRIFQAGLAVRSEFSCPCWSVFQ